MLTTREKIETPFDQATILADGAATAGKFALLEIVVPVGGGTPPHVHHREDEAFYVLAGEVEFAIAAPGGTYRLRATAGDFVHGPRDVPHHFTNVGATPLRMLVWVAPAGFEQMVRRMGALPPGPPDFAAITAICNDCGIDFLPPFDGGTTVPAGAPIPAELVALRRGAGEVLDVVGEATCIKATAAQTGGAWSFFEIVSRPGGGTPPHVHTLEDEAFYVLEGELTVTRAGTPHVLGPGEFVYGPLNVPHYFTNTGAAPSRTLVWAVPGGFERFFRDAALLPLPPSIPDFAVVCRKYGMELLLPPG